MSIFFSKALVLIAVVLVLACQPDTHEGAGIGEPLEMDAAAKARILDRYDAVAVTAVSGLAGGGFHVAGRSAQTPSCGECHQSGTMAQTPRTAPDARHAHWEIDLTHADGMTCRVCHSTDQPEKLKHLGGTTTMDHAYRACAQCHQDQFSDWHGGAHGKRLTGWAEPRVIQNCTGCHNPHAPALAKRLPVAHPTIVPERIQKKESSLMPGTRKLDFGSFMRMLVAPEPEKKSDEGQAAGGCGCGSGGCGSGDAQPSGHTLLDKPMGRRGAIAAMLGGAAATAAAGRAAASITQPDTAKEVKQLEWEEYFKGNFRLMTRQEQRETIERLERLAELKRNQNPSISGTHARPDTLYGYAFNISTCRGYRDCVSACVEENNQDRDSNMQYIRIFEIKNGSMNLDDGKADYFHEVPAEGHFYVGTQCFQCENPPCVTVCPVGATWKEPDGITVIDYDWCIGCRYCQAACPYWARRFNWKEPEVPAQDVNQKQHYLGNRPRKKGVMEKCTFCIQRTREGSQPACAEACPTGSRIFGNLLDPDSEIRYVLENKKVFRLKEDLGTEPKFWYFMD